MKKKLYKMTKSIIISFMIVGCVFSSYASIDGIDNTYSYVSQKEFNDTLKDFNDRISIFEAGINAKIDSQVSSYLDRYGIWSKKEQVLVNDKYRVTDINVEGWKIVGTGKPETFWPNRVIISEIDKSGLAFIYVSLNSLGSTLAFGSESNFYSDSDRLVNYSSSDSDEALMKCLSVANVRYWFEFMQKDATNNYTGDKAVMMDTFRSSFALAPRSSNGTRVYTEGWCVPPGEYVTTLFVSKGNSLHTKLAWTYTSGQYGTSVFMRKTLLQTTTHNKSPKETGDNKTATKPLLLSIEKIHVY